ncbi:MAG TPA: hypothetical protein VNE40_02905 [Candidatus Dormibacteraeota bacterium]|nr:hypothetical protein [Candidatus Dormibacteraeota bacterium]
MSARTLNEDGLWDYYYDAIELISNGDLPEAEKLLVKALVLDPS